MVNYCSISGKVLDGGGSPVPNASIVFNPVVPQVVQGQYVQPILLNSLTGDDGTMLPIALPWGLVVQITVNNAAPFTVVVPSIGAVSFGALAMNAWPVLTFNPSTFFLLEDFQPNSLGNGAIGSFGWTLHTISSTPTLEQEPAEASHFGITRMTTAATTLTGGALAAASSPATQLTQDLVLLNNWQLSLVFRLRQTLATRFIAGMVNDYTSAPAITYCGIRYDDILGDVNFQFVSSNGGVSTVVDSGIPADTGWHTLTLWAGVTDLLLYSLDGSSPLSISSNLPPGGLTPAFQLLTGANVAKSVDLDFFSLAVPSLLR